jgi:hypothetical protein
LKPFFAKGEENIGMAMTFTLVSHLRERLSSLVRSRAEKIRKQEAEKERLALEVFIGTATSFNETQLLTV